MSGSFAEVSISAGIFAMETADRPGMIIFIVLPRLGKLFAVNG